MKRLLIVLLLLAALPAMASETNGTVLSTDKYAWGDLIGWINFAPTDGSDYVGLRITDDAVTGFAWSREHGWINFAPGSSGQGVTNTPEGELGGSAWVASLGWISMEGVTINEDGEFVGIAGTAGTDTARISFDCGNCSVVTDWRPASVRGDSDDGGDDDGGGNPGGGRGGGSEDPDEAPGTGEAAEADTDGLLGRILDGLRSLVADLADTGPAQGLIGPGGVNGGEGFDNADGTDSAGGIPGYLFDITLRLEQSVIPVGTPLIANTSYVSFGTLPTPVTADYEIRDARGTVLGITTQSFIVETERNETAEFATGTLAPGTYTLHLRVVYGAGTVEEFDQTFTVTSSGYGCSLPWPLSWAAAHVPGFGWVLSWFGCWFPWILLLILLALAYGMYRWLRDRRRDRELAPPVLPAAPIS